LRVFCCSHIIYGIYTIYLPALGAVFLFSIRQNTGREHDMGRKKKFSEEEERKIQIIIRIYKDEKMMKSDAEIAEICKSEGLDVNEKYIERIRKKMNIKQTVPRGGARERKEDEAAAVLEKQHREAVFLLSKKRKWGGQLEIPTLRARSTASLAAAADRAVQRVWEHLRERRRGRGFITLESAAAVVIMIILTTVCIYMYMYM